MILLFVLTVAAIFLGGVCLWISGMMFGTQNRTVDSDGLQENQELQKENEKFRREVERLQAEVEEVRDRRFQVEENSEKVAMEIDRIAAEKEAATEEIERLRDELHALRQRGKDSLPKLPMPARQSSIPPIHAESEAIDAVQADLDMERVAHQKTKEELAQVKKIAAIKMGTQPSSFGSPGRRSGFKTLSIASGGTASGGAAAANGSEDESGAQKALAQIQAEKDRIESELARTKQELQLLKMRQ